MFLASSNGHLVHQAFCNHLVGCGKPLKVLSTTARIATHSSIRVQSTRRADKCLGGATPFRWWSASYRHQHDNKPQAIVPRPVAPCIYSTMSNAEGSNPSDDVNWNDQQRKATGNPDTKTPTDRESYTSRRHPHATWSCEFSHRSKHESRRWRNLGSIPGTETAVPQEFYARNPSTHENAQFACSQRSNHESEQ